MLSRHKANRTKSGSTADGGVVPVAVIMITLNEAHNIEDVFRNIQGWAQEIFLVDSYSSDNTVDIALRHGVHVVQRRFRGFGDQWNFALRELPITAPWTMKLDPDERLTELLKQQITNRIQSEGCDGFYLRRRLWFMGRPLPVRQGIVRVWRTGRCRFTDVSVNEHPIVDGRVVHVAGELEHHDSPHLEHWFDKQNRYTTLEAERRCAGVTACNPKLMGTALERRMWLKKHFDKVPFRFTAMFLYLYLGKGLFRAGWVGYAWSRLRAQVHWMRHLKYRELQLIGQTRYKTIPKVTGAPDERVKQYE